MIIGNPDNFAILVDIVDSWNVNKTFGEGIMLYYVDGVCFPKKELYSATMSIEIANLKYKIEEFPMENHELYSAPKNEAFLALFRLAHSDDIDRDEDRRYEITPFCLSDHGCYAYAVSNGENIRILIDEMDYDWDTHEYDFDHLDVKEAFIKPDEFQKILEKLDAFWSAYKNDTLL